MDYSLLLGVHFRNTGWTSSPPVTDRVRAYFPRSFPFRPPASALRSWVTGRASLPLVLTPFLAPTIPACCLPSIMCTFCHLPSERKALGATLVDSLLVHESQDSVRNACMHLC